MGRQRNANASSEVHPFSYFGVPAQAGMSDWYEHSLPCRRSGPQTRLSSESMSRIRLRQRRIRLRSICRAGIQKGRGGVRPPYRLPTPVGRDFHSLMRPAQGNGDSGEGMSRIRLRQRRIRPPQAICLRHGLRSIWRAGIQRGGEWGKRSEGACPPQSSGLLPTS